jgi:hypothetical protein
MSAITVVIALAASRQIQEKEFNYLTAPAQRLVGTSGSPFSVRCKDERQTGAKYHPTIETGGEECKASGRTCAMGRECC